MISVPYATLMAIGYSFRNRFLPAPDPGGGAFPLWPLAPAPADSDGGVVVMLRMNKVPGHARLDA